MIRGGTYEGKAEGLSFQFRVELDEQGVVAALSGDIFGQDQFIAGYSALKGVTREVIVRELRSGREVARRTFPYPSSARCLPISFLGEPDRFVFAKHKTIRRWILDQVRSSAGSRARAQAASANRGHQEGKRAAAHQPDRASARPPAPGRSDKTRELGSQLSKAL